MIYLFSVLNESVGMFVVDMMKSYGCCGKCCSSFCCDIRFWIVGVDFVGCVWCVYVFRFLLVLVIGVYIIDLNLGILLILVNSDYELDFM